jgi:hypothetical protein
MRKTLALAALLLPAIREKPMDNIMWCQECGKESDPETPDICGHCLCCTEHCDNDPAYHQEAQ